MTGALMGTPSFMSPEQAAGKVRSLDRRTDVYSLGATLYDVLAGRPPIVANTLASLLLSIEHEEPAALRQIERDVPQDLEAIVMKCLEKQPAARYDSAKALGDDLQRFLDGDPVEARRRSLGYVLWKRAKRHKAKVALASVMLAVTSVFVGASIRARRIAAEQAILSRELGESVKEMEFFLRNAHGMPLHDIDRERNIVRERLKAIESRMRAAGEIGAGPGHYALGRGYLTLQEPEAALAHLRRAEAAGYRSAGLDYAMGMALSEVYRKQLADTKRMEGEQKKQRIQAIEAEYKQPALARLEAALGGAIEAPAYVEGLIAFHGGRHEEALAKAREAFEKAPWLYEAKKLEGDVLFAMGNKFGHDAAFDYEKMSKFFGEAGEAYRVAADLGRSDPSVHLATCELFTQEMNGAFERGVSMRPSFERATAACGRALSANPLSGAGHVKLAWVHNCFAWRVATGAFPGEKPEEALVEATRQAEEAVRRSPEDPMALYVVASVWRTRAVHALDRGLDVVPAVDHAIAAYAEALRLDPAFLWAQNESCSAYGLRGTREAMRGTDPGPSMKEAIAHCHQAIALDPGFTYARANEIIAQVKLAEHRVDTGQSPRDSVLAAEALIDAFRKQAPGAHIAHLWIAVLARLDATYALDSGGDPAPALARIESSAQELARVAPTSTLMQQQVRGEEAVLRARYHFERGEDPSPWLSQGRDAFAKATKEMPWDLSYRIGSASVEAIALRWAIGEGKATEAQFDAALAPLRPFLDTERADPRLYQVLGEIEELRAALRIGRGNGAAGEVAAGLARIAQALALNPRLGSALACKGRLLLLRARAEKDRREAQRAASMALESFSAAIAANPLLERRELQGIEQARRLAKQDAPRPE
jgi:serine/threonine-protein kinase